MASAFAPAPAMAAPAPAAPLAVAGSDFGGSGNAGGGEVARELDAPALFALSSDTAGDYWMIVASATNEYGVSDVASDEFVWDIAAGEFSADWFFLA
jgi:hypothetical protein